MIEDYENGYEFSIRGSSAVFNFLYPRQKKVKSIEVGLEDVRAADSILIEYDFDRDGYVIRMDETKYIENGGGCEVIKEKQEVAFISAWNEKE